MTVPRPSRLTLITAALLALLPALAILQYRWVGQVSEAERERMQRNLSDAARQFRDALDHEVGRAFMSLLVDAGIVRDQAWDRYAERYAAWAGTTPNSAIVANVFLVDGAEGRVRLRRWNTQTHQFELADWPEPLAASRAHFEQAFAAFTAGRQGEPDEVPPFRDEESLLVTPLFNVRIGRPPGDRPHQMRIVTMFGFTVVQLNIPFIRDQLLPALAQRHFTQTDGATYHVAVVDAKNPRRLIYRSSAAAPVDLARADAIETLLFPHGDPMMFLARDAAAHARTDVRRNLVVTVRKAGNGSASTVRAGIFGDGRWRLLVRHQSGSLEAAVASVRQRNLLISFGILVLMGVSIGLLWLTSRRAQELARQQMELVAGVSHELRTPVAVIRAAAENLSHGVVGNPDGVRRYGDAIQVEARRLGEMLERVLQFAGIESGRAVATTRIAIDALIEEAVEAAAPVAGASPTIERQVGPDLPTVLGDAGALRSAIQNLITNALKYGGADQWVGINVKAFNDRRGREVRITVEDHGRGIAASDLPHIFQPFYRGSESVARQIQGSGLGLALVKRIAEAHGGRVTVVSHSGTGSAFTIHLPASATDALGSERVGHQSVAGGLRVSR